MICLSKKERECEEIIKISFNSSNQSLFDGLVSRGIKFENISPEKNIPAFVLADEHSIIFKYFTFNEIYYCLFFEESEEFLKLQFPRGIEN